MASNDGSVEKYSDDSDACERGEPTRNRIVDLLLPIDLGHILIGTLLTVMFYLPFAVFDVAMEGVEAKRAALGLDRRYSKSGKDVIQFVMPDSLSCEKLLKSLSDLGFSMKIGDTPVAVSNEGLEAGCRLESRDLLLWKNL